MKIPSQIPPLISILFFLLLLLLGGWFNRNELLAQFYLIRFRMEETGDAKCSNLMQILTASREANLDWLIQRVYPEGQYSIKRSGLLSGGYAVALLRESGVSDLQIVLFQKKWNGDFQMIFSCGKSMG